MAYVKLFGSILASTIWGEDDKTRLVWITMLACADRDGVVQAAVPGLAHLARVSVSDCAKAIQVLLSPDAHSRTKAHEGRRIEAIEGGWLILNYELYRDRATIEERREKDRQRQIRKRARDAKRDVSRDVTVRHAPSREITLSDADADAKASVPVPSTSHPSFHPFARGTVQEAAEPEMEGRKEAVDSLTKRLGRSKRP